MVHTKLVDLRKERGLSQGELASKVAMEQTTYSRKERGKSIITNEEWSRIAEALDVSVEDIQDDKSVNLKNENCTFNDNSSVVGVQYVSVPQEILDAVLRYNKKLEDENEELKRDLKRK